MTDVGKYAADMAMDPTQIREGGYHIGDGKYVVFKVSDFYTMMGRLALPPAWGIDENNDVIGANLDCAVLSENICLIAKEYEVPDATVLRDQDVLTAAALNTYADAAMIVSDTLSDVGSDSMVESLRNRADFFRARAMRAQEAPNRRLPD